MPRLFIALSLPADVRDALLDCVEERLPLRWQSEDQLHLTLRFVGEIDRRAAEDLDAALSSLHAASLVLAIRGVGRFDHGRRGALWAGVGPRPPLKALHDKIDRACQAAGVPPDRRAFHPHITLARWSGGAVDPAHWLVRHANLAAAPFRVDRFTLFESRLGRHGAAYDALAHYPLRDGKA